MDELRTNLAKLLCYYFAGDDATELMFNDEHKQFKKHREAIFKNVDEVISTIEETHVLVPKGEYNELNELLEIGAKWMQWWLENNECDCDGYGHTCGRMERTKELGRMNAALLRTNQ